MVVVVVVVGVFQDVERIVPASIDGANQCTHFGPLASLPNLPYKYLNALQNHRTFIPSPIAVRTELKENGHAKNKRPFTTVFFPSLKAKPFVYFPYYGRASLVFL